MTYFNFPIMRLHVKSILTFLLLFSFIAVLASPGAAALEGSLKGSASSALVHAPPPPPPPITPPPVNHTDDLSACGITTPCVPKEIDYKPKGYGPPIGDPIGVVITIGDYRNQTGFIDLLDPNSNLIGPVAVRDDVQTVCHEEYWVGAKVTVVWEVDESGNYNQGYATYKSLKCIAKKTTVQPIECVVAMKINFSMTYPTTKVKYEKYKPSDFGKKPTFKNCVASHKESISLPAGKKNASKNTATEYGRYIVASTGWTQRGEEVTVVNPIRNTTEKTFKLTGSVVEKPVKYTYIQHTCDEYRQGAKSKEVYTKNKKYTQDDCARATSQEEGDFQCNAIDNTWINGQKSKKATLFRDGGANRVLFSVPKLSGTTYVKGSQKLAKTRLFRTGTPWDSSVSKTRTPVQIMKAGSSTPLKINAQDRTSYTTGGITEYDIRGYLASEAESPTTLQNEYVMEGKWKVITRRISEVTVTGKVKLVETTAVIDSTATCMSPVVSLNFVRGVNSY